MKRLLLAGAVLALLAGCQNHNEDSNAAKAVPAAALQSGVDKSGMDLGVRPQDDYYAYANGTWLKATEIPADQVGWGSYMTMRDESLGQLKTIIEDVAADTAADDATSKIGNYFNAYMDADRVEALQIDPLKAELARIDALENNADVAAYFGASNVYGVSSPISVGIGQDDKDSTRYAIFMWQGGLGLPDREYYFDDSERGLEIRAKYRVYLEQILTLSGYADPQAGAQHVIDLETELARNHWSKEDRRDADKTYNKVTDAELGKLLSNYNLDAFFEGFGSGRQEYVIVGQPSYMEAVNKIIVDTDLQTWKEYLRTKLLTSYASYLPAAYVDANFEFYGKTLSGREEQQPRWQRAVSSVNGNLGELLGQLYVAKHFSPEAKAKTEELVDNLIAAYADSIKKLDWMSAETKIRALDKLSKFTPKIGYPDKWRDYSDLEISKTDLLANARNARTFDHYREIDKLGKPIDRTEWGMPPQTINAYYNASMNEIVFPAAYLQDPNFKVDAEDAWNYGAIGVTIGHEIGHGFDDQGSKYDGDGNLKSWWTDEDRTNFDAKTSGLVAQYNKFEALPGMFVNGAFTLGENIGDLGGVAIALKAYHMSLNGKESPVIDGFTGNERFFLANAQSSRIKWRPELIEILIKSDPHSPDQFRTNGVAQNTPAFYDTYQVKEGDKLYLPEEERIQIW